jgi:hypothetical protein
MLMDLYKEATLFNLFTYILLKIAIDASSRL